MLLTVDVVAGAAAGQRPFRWLRPLLLLLRNREQRRIATALLHLLRVQLGAALAFATLLLVFVGAVCVHLYRPVYAAEAAASGGRNAFDNVLTAALELWVLELMRHTPVGDKGWHDEDSFVRTAAAYGGLSAIHCGAEAMLGSIASSFASCFSS